MFLSKLDSILLLDLSLVGQVTFIPYKNHNYVRVGMFLNGFDPLLDTLKT